MAINTGKTWSPAEEDALVRWHKNGSLSLEAIANRLGRTPFACEIRLQYIETRNQKEKTPMSSSSCNAVCNTMDKQEDYAFLETRTFLRGRDITTYSKYDIYSVIAKQEQRVLQLMAIEHKPKSFSEEIQQINSDLMRLINYLDNNEST